MDIWLVSPAFGRVAVTDLVLAERRWLCDRLAERGWAANSVIVADDDNLDVARSYGFATVELGNDDLGAKFNAGYRYAAKQGADVFVHVGSDDWVHPDAFDVLADTDLSSFEPDMSAGCAVWSDGPEIVTQKRLTVVSLVAGIGRRCQVRGRWGCIPWLIPRNALQPSGFQPLKLGLRRGIDGALARKLQANWTVRDAPAEWIVDFKTGENITPYAGLASALGVGDETAPAEMLAPFYPADLVARVAAWR